jgi:glucose/arabinose dehydrogenase
VPALQLADEAAARLRVPEGFAVRVFAAELDTPRSMTVGLDRSLQVAERGRGRVIRLPDRDGQADGVEMVETGLRAPHNMKWYRNCLYVAENYQVSRHCPARRNQH